VQKLAFIKQTVNHLMELLHDKKKTMLEKLQHGPNEVSFPFLNLKM